MSKLTDTQLVILAGAAARHNHAVLPPAQTVGLNKSALGKVINSLLSRSLITEVPAGVGDGIWHEDGDQRFSLIITATGLEAIGVDSIDPSPQDLADLEHQISDRPLTSRRSGKVEAILDLLRRPEGASIVDMNAATDWQAHSIRAFLSGLRKKGMEITRTKDDAGKAIYKTMSEQKPAGEVG